MCECTQTMVTSQKAGSLWGTPPYRKRSSATSFLDPAARQCHYVSFSLFNLKHLKRFDHRKWYTSHLFAELEVNRFTIATHTVKHASFDTISTHCSLTQLTGTPICRIVFHQQKCNLTLPLYCKFCCVRIANTWPSCLTLTSDVVGVVEAVAVEFAGLCLFSWRTLLLLARLAEWVSTPLPGTVPATWLRSNRSYSDLLLYYVQQNSDEDLIEI